MNAATDAPVPIASLHAASVRAAVRVPLRFADGYASEGEFYSFDGLADSSEHVAVRLGDVQGVSTPLVRLHSECLTGDVFGSQRCDCGAQLREAVERISDVGGFLLYLRQEGRGIGLYNKIDSYLLQDQGADTFAANRAIGRGNDERDYTVAAQMLRALGVTRIALLSNNPDKETQLRRLGIDIVHRVPTGVHLSEANRSYLTAKVDLAAHTMVIADHS